MNVLFLYLFYFKEIILYLYKNVFSFMLLVIYRNVFIIKFIFYFIFLDFIYIKRNKMELFFWLRGEKVSCSKVRIC